MAMRSDGAPRRSVARLGKSSVEAAPVPPAGGRTVLWDAEVKGFGVRVAPSGARTYVLSYRMGGREAPKRTVTIGRHGSPWTTDQARRRALDLLALVRKGVDPVAEREQAREAAVGDAERRAARSFDLLADRWMREHVRRSGLRSFKDIEGVVERDLKPAFAGRSVDDITRADVAEALERIGVRSEAAANKAHKWARAMFNWFIDKGVLASSPLDRMSRPYPEGSRVRTLSLLELVVVWTACDALPKPFGSFYRTLALLGQRLREVSDLPSGELDLEAAEWLLPASRTKNAREHAVRLPTQAVAILQPLAGERTSKFPVFTTDGRVGVAGFSKMKVALDEAVAEVLADCSAARAELGMTLAPWVVHDLRRTLATGCQAMGVAREVTEGILNHVSGTRGGITGVYQTYDYFDEKAAALERWAELVEAAVAKWATGDVAAIVEMDPVRSARRRRRARRDRIGAATAG